MFILLDDRKGSGRCTASTGVHLEDNSRHDRLSQVGLSVISYFAHTHTGGEVFRKTLCGIAFFPALRLDRWTTSLTTYKTRHKVSIYSLSCQILFPPCLRPPGIIANCIATTCSPDSKFVTDIFYPYPISLP